MEKVAPYGSWESPIAAAGPSAVRVAIGETFMEGGNLYWLESRPQEAGRVTLMKRDSNNEVSELLAAPFSARSTVHEYGGGSYLVHQGIVYFSSFEDQRLWVLASGADPHPLTPSGKQRYANAVMDSVRNRLICVRENHDVQQGQAVNELVAIPLDGSAITVLATGSDFYASPRLSPSGARLAWLSWNHPDMPWDHTKLLLADFDDQGQLTEPTCIAGEKVESVFQPEWVDDQHLTFVADRSGWWNLYEYAEGDTLALYPKDAEFGKPQWSFGMNTYGQTSDNRLMTMYGQNGTWKLAELNRSTQSLVDFALPYTSFNHLCVRGNLALFVGSAPNLPPELVLLNLQSGQSEVVKRSSVKMPDPNYTSLPEAVTFPTAAGLQAHGFYYPPHNKDYQAPAGSLPPMITIVHGGPTGATSASYSIGVQYWTSRGFAVFDVNHGGSTGYGRDYRNRLRHMWGVVDVEDATLGATYLVSQGKADPDKLIIRGGSAGGYTTLAALAFHDVFKAGASYYGISDLVLLAQETHKFESRYPEQLIGPYPARSDIYESRSPIHHLEGLDRPVILLQGLQDKVVPPNQSELILEALKERGIPVAYVAFPGEQHGFRKAENIIRAYQSEHYFYARVLGFDPPAGVEEVHIFNLPAK